MTAEVADAGVAERARPATSFVLPAGCEATEPPEARGVPRDGVRLLVARPGRVEHRRFHDLADVLSPGDVLVVNTSVTSPAALEVHRSSGAGLPLHVAAELDDGRWVVEPRRSDGRGPARDVEAGDVLTSSDGVRLRLEQPYPQGARTRPGGRRLWTATATPGVVLSDHLARFGRPVTYGHLRGRVELEDLQTVYARDTGDGRMGSAEMPSAGRPLTERGLTRLVAAGVVVAPLVLHAGVSSPEAGEPPTPERFAVPAGTARLVNLARATGSRVVAVGTTVVRALESASDPEAPGTVRARSGWTDLVLGPDRPAEVVTGLVSGLHEPQASHLLLLEAVARELVAPAYAAAVAERYLWHEFGDSMLLLP